MIAVLAVAALATAPALAQPAQPDRPAKAKPSRTAEAGLDRGPFTPEANRAYQGGGVILQGAPGGPAPVPEPTPPGQSPRNMVPPR